MRRLIFPVSLAIAAYFLYALSLPDKPSAPVMAMSPRVTEEITLDAIDYYAISFGEYELLDTAKAEAAKYAVRGAAYCIANIDGKYRALGAMYLVEQEANSAVRRLYEDNGIRSGIVNLSSDELTVRITSESHKVAAIRSAIKALYEYPYQLLHISKGIDKGTIDSDTARALLSVASGEVDNVARELEYAIGATSDKFAANILDMSISASERLKDIVRSENSGLMLSSSIKQYGLDTIIRMINVIEDMNTK